jgi:hypothetical protein
MSIFFHAMSFFYHTSEYRHADIDALIVFDEKAGERDLDLLGWWAHPTTASDLTIRTPI